MKNIKIILAAFLMLGSLSSCIKQRIEPDFSIYGDKAFITGVTTFDYRTVTRKLNYNEEVTGYEVRAVNNTVTIDNVNFKINILVAKIAPATVTAANPQVDLAKVGIRLVNQGTKIEPLNSAPTAGIIADFSKGPYVYRIYSADGSVRDWTLTFAITP
ncbi:DUF5018-related domain-containing protein [Pedobacter frigoris]|uniref:DUF5018-related domain-containing protein n=1 Tax=Pedobacter frigoris TaxID=2571272 RepID=UPI00292EA6C9|nr:hypothetical protein [Pedobacter frigoris]